MMRAPGLSSRCLASATHATIPSSRPALPIVSVISTSARSGSSTSDEWSSMTVMRSASPLRATIRRASSATSPCSIAYTRDAPAIAANSESTPVPAPMSTTVSPGLTVARMAFMNVSVRSESDSIE